MTSPTATANPNSSTDIVFTDSAAAKVSELILDEGNLALKLRVFIQGGGCSGFQYGFTFDEHQHADDRVVEKQVPLQSQTQADADDGDERSATASNSMTVRLLVDPMSFQYLLGAEIDFKKDVAGEQFIIRNPNAKTTCGCGSSFSA